MHSNFMHWLSNGKAISLPAPTFTAVHCVVEQPKRVLVLFGVKTPAEHSAHVILERCRAAAPDLEWIVHNDPFGHSNGSPDGFQFYEIQKVGKEFVINPEGVGDMSFAFTHGIEADKFVRVLRGRPVQDFSSLLSPAQE